MSRYHALKEAAWAANMEIPAQNLAIHTWGNASALDPDAGVLAIKPSGIPYPDLKVSDMVVLDLEGRVVEGSLKPSSDTKTHLVIYREFASRGILGVVHTHSSHATAWAQACRPIPLLGTTHADHLCQEVPCTAYIDPPALERDYEKETGELICRHFAQTGLKPEEVPMVLVAGHGPFTWGSTAQKAIYHAAVLEELARMAWISLTLNPGLSPLPPHIVQKHYLRKHGPGAYYGQGGR